MKANRKGASQETAKDETLGVRRTPRASSDASTSGSATEVAFDDTVGEELGGIDIVGSMSYTELQNASIEQIVHEALLG